MIKIHKLVACMLVAFFSLFHNFSHAMDQEIDISCLLRPHDISQKMLEDLTTLLRSSPYWKKGQGKNFFDCWTFSQVAYLFLTHQTNNDIYRLLVRSLTGLTQGDFIEYTTKILFTPNIQRYIFNKSSPSGIINFWNKGLYVLKVGNDQYLAYDEVIGTTILTKREWADRLLSGIREEIQETKYWKPRFRQEDQRYYSEILEVDSWLKMQSIYIPAEWAPL